MSTENENPTLHSAGQPTEQSKRRHIVALAKAACGVLLLGFLFWQAKKSDAFEQLLTQPKNWGFLAAALGLSVASVLLSFVRWRLVVRSAGIAFSLGEALRVGALGFALNFVGPGAVSGDLYKAVVLCRGRPGQRAAAFTTIFVDRVLGLLSMLGVASVAVLIFGYRGLTMSTEVTIICQTVTTVAAVGFIGVACLFIPGLAGERLEQAVRKAPMLGGVLGDFVAAWATYRQNKLRLATACTLCPAIVLLFVSSFYCVALGLPLDSPPYLEHCFIVPIQLTAAALVPTPQGVGAREFVVEYFYRGLGVAKGQGTLIAFGHTLTMLAAGGIATVYYFARRSSPDTSVLAADSVAE